MNNQGKRPDQTKTSEKIIFYSFIGMIIVFIIQVILDLTNNK
jgi:hypothetical protein